MDEFKDARLLEAFDSEDLIRQMVCDKDTCAVTCHEVRFWFALDVNGKPIYPGFDFASAKGEFDHDAKVFSLSELHLIQATISLQSKTLHRTFKERRSVFMYYGIPCIGKSTLSVALEYFFGLLYETTWYARLSHNPSVDSQAIVHSLLSMPTTNAPSPYRGVYVIDQINPGIIDADELLNQCSSREYPLIMFTSGHHMPTGTWTTTNNVKITGIQILYEASIESGNQFAAMKQTL